MNGLPERETGGGTGVPSQVTSPGGLRKLVLAPLAWTRGAEGTRPSAQLSHPGSELCPLSSWGPMLLLKSLAGMTTVLRPLCQNCLRCFCRVFLKKKK